MLMIIPNICRKNIAKFLFIFLQSHIFRRNRSFLCNLTSKSICFLMSVIPEVLLQKVQTMQYARKRQGRRSYRKNIWKNGRGWRNFSAKPWIRSYFAVKDGHTDCPSFLWNISYIPPKSYLPEKPIFSWRKYPRDFIYAHRWHMGKMLRLHAGHEKECRLFRKFFYTVYTFCAFCCCHIVLIIILSYSINIHF